MKKSIPAILFGAGFALASAASQAAPVLSFNFTQGGFDDNATVSVSFTGSDADGDSRLNSFLGEISAFSLSFSGNSLVRAFAHGGADLSGLIYDLGSGSIGDAFDGVDEGIASNWPPGGPGFTYSAGLVLNAVPGGAVIDNEAGGAMSTTLEPLLVRELNAVPEPGTLALLGFPLLTLAARRRKRQADGSAAGISKRSR